MAAEPGKKLSDEALEQMTRVWFADVQAQPFKKPLSLLSENASGDVGANLLEWLLDAGDDAGDDNGGD